MTGQGESSWTASLAVTGQGESSWTASIAVTGQDESSQAAFLAVTGQDESSQKDTTDTSGGSAANAATSGGSTVEPWPGESMLLGTTTLQGAEASTTAWRGSAADAFPWGSTVVVYVAQMQQCNPHPGKRFGQG